MRKLSLLFLPAVIGMMAAGCARIEPEIPENPRETAKKDEILISKSFQAEVAETRTSLEGLSVLFAQGESISIWDGSENREFKADEAGSNVSFSGQVSAMATEFYALSPYSSSTVFTKRGSTVTAKTTLPSEQTAVAGTFADGLNISAAQSDSDDSFSLDNVLTVVKFNLESANLGGHAVTSVELTSTYPLAGDVTVTYGETSSAAAGANTVNKVTLAKADGSTLEDGSYYFVVLPNAGGQISLKFTASDGYTATRTATLKSAFEAGSLKNLGTVKGLNWLEPKYIRVSSSLSDWTGDYLIVYEAEPAILSGFNSSNYGTMGAVEIAANQTISWEGYKDYNVSIEKNGSGYSLYLEGVGYLGAEDDANKLNSSNTVKSNAYRWNISIGADGNLLISNLSVTGRALLCNPSSTGRRFCAYKISSIGNNVKNIWLYRKSGSSSSATVALSTEEASNITASTAILNASYSGLSPINVQEVGFKWGLSASELTSTVYDNSSFTTSSGTISATISSLAENTTYYYQVTMMVYDSASKSYVEFTGAIRSFKTQKGSGPGILDGWLELPLITGDEDYVGTFYGSGGTDGDNRNYSYNYSFTWFASMWVAYPLNKSHTQGSASSSWAYNPDFDSKYQVNMTGNSYPTMYNQSNYSKGHQIPNADRKSDATMNAQTYYVTNQTPQIQNGFNGGIWGSLENSIRSLLTDPSETIYIATGPAYRKVGEDKTITYFEADPSHPEANPKSLPVPNYYWKVILRVKWSGDTVSSASTIGFWFEHQVYSNDSYTNYIESVNTIEEWTGLDLFTNLPDELEEVAESNIKWKDFQEF